MKYRELAETVLQLAGGEKNVITYSHCSTRLRFDLLDENAADKVGLGKLDGVLSVVEVAGQLQVVLGPKVADVFRELQVIFPGEGLGGERRGKKKKGIMGGALEVISSLFTPIIDVLIGAGILKGILSILTATGILAAGSGTFQILNAAADSLYYFLPVILAITCSKRFHTNIFVSVTVAVALLYPDLISLYESGAAITFLGIPVQLTTFKSSVFPVIFAILLLAFVEKKLNQWLPEAIRSRTAPFFSLLVVVPITIIVFGPLGSMLSNGIAGLYMGLYGYNKIIAGGFIGAVAQVLVIFGIHWGLFPIIFSNIEKFGYDTILAVFGPSIIAQSGAAFGVLLKTKNKNVKKIATPAAIMGFFGISETAIYGINLKYKKPFIMAVIGGGIGGAIAGASGARAMAVAVASVPTLPAYFGIGFKGFVIGYFGAFVISAVLTYFFGFSDDMLEDDDIGESGAATGSFSKSGEELLLFKPIKGKTISVSEVGDPAFSSEAMGKGIAVIPKEGKLYSPVSGTVSVVFETGHAYGIIAKNQEEILLHIGIDTVKLGGQYFTPKVVQGDIVLAGDLLAEFDLEALKAAGYDPTTMLIITNSREETVFRCLESGEGIEKKLFAGVTL